LEDASIIHCTSSSLIVASSCVYTHNSYCTINTTL
jgi:hypothetical protein